MRRLCLSLLAMAVVVGWLGASSARADDGVFKLLGAASTNGSAVQAVPVRWGCGGYGYGGYGGYGYRAYRPYYGGYYSPYSYGSYYAPYSYGNYYTPYYGGYGYRPGFGLGVGFY